MTDEVKLKRKTKLRRMSELLWKLVTTTPGVGDLAEPMKRAEFHFERLTQRQQVTIAIIAKQLVEGFDAIEEEIRQEAQEKAVEAVTPDEIIPPAGSEATADENEI